MTTGAIMAFQSAMASADLTPPPEIIADGALHTFQAAGDKRPHSWYIVHPGDPTTGAFGCWKRGIRRHWRVKDRDAMTPTERAAYRAQVAQMVAARARHREEYEREVSRRARELWDAAQPAESHPYLDAHRVRPHGLRVHGSFLLIPVHDVTGQLDGLQTVHEGDDGPTFLPGTRLRGNLYLMGDVKDVVNVYVDYTSAARHHEATREAVAVAFTAENMEPVKKLLTAKHPQVHIVVGGAERTVGGGERGSSADAAAPAVEPPQASATATEKTFSEADAKPRVASEARIPAKVDIWMPLYVGDYLADTQRLTTEQHGAYLLLLMDYWRNGPPPDDDAVLATITRLSLQQWRRIRPILEPHFQIQGGRWTHKRVERELAEALENKRKAYCHSQLMHDARWGEKRKKDAARTANSNASSTSVRSNGAMPKAMLQACSSPSPKTNPPISPNGGDATTPESAKDDRASRRKPAVTIDTFIEQCKAAGEDAIPESDPVFGWATKAGLPHEFLRLCWREFVTRHREGEKRQKDWRATFRRCVRDNWYRLWYLDEKGYGLTTQGRSAEKVHAATAG